MRTPSGTVARHSRDGPRDADGDFIHGNFIGEQIDSNGILVKMFTGIFTVIGQRMSTVLQLDLRPPITGISSMGANKHCYDAAAKY